MITQIQKNLIFFLFIFFPLTGMQDPKWESTLEHRKRKSDELFCRLWDPFRARPIIQVTALNEQIDKFSCVARMFYHAECMEIAAIRAKKQGILFKESLKELLSQTELLEQTYQNVNSYLDDHYPFYDRARGLGDQQILGICKDRIPSLKDKMLLVELEKNNRVFAISDPMTSSDQSPLEYSYHFIYKYNTKDLPRDRCMVNLDQSTGLRYQLKKLETPWQPCHFICLIPHHAFLASAISDNAEAVLYVIDSANTPLEKSPYMSKLVSKLLAYVEAHNNNKSKKFKSS